VKKILIAVVLCLVLVGSMGVPATAKAGGPPFSSTNILLDEILYLPGLVPTIDYIPVHIEGTGNFTGHVVKPTSEGVMENSWFELTAFTGQVILFYGTPYESIIPYDYNGMLKIDIHLGTQPSKPNITIKSSVPIFIPIINAWYTDIKIVGGKVIFARLSF
jgi:hypothetical protein